MPSLKIRQRGMPHEHLGAPQTYRDAVIRGLMMSPQSRASLAGLPDRFEMKRGVGAVMQALEELVDEGLVERYHDGDNGAGQPIEMYRLTSKGWDEEEEAAEEGAEPATFSARAGVEPGSGRVVGEAEA